MSSPSVTIPYDGSGVLTPIPEEIPQSPVLSLAAPSESDSTVPTLILPDSSKEQYDGNEPFHIPIPTVTFLLDYPPSQQQHIILPLSDTYQDAIQSLSSFYETHKGFLQGPLRIHADPDKTILEIWSGASQAYALIEPLLWSQLVHPGALIKVSTVDHDGSDFVHGPVYLCFGKPAENGSLKTVWTVPDVHDIIDCPFTYKNAVELVKRRINQGGDAVQEWKKKDLTHASFTFYTLRSFKNAYLVDTQLDAATAPKKNPSGVIATIKRWFGSHQTLESLDERVWTKLHPDTYVDEETWRLWVPLPGACLGVIIEEKKKEYTCRIKRTNNPTSC